MSQNLNEEAEKDNLDVPHAHDRFFKKMMSDIETAREFFKIHLPEDICQFIHLDSLELMPGSYVDDLRKETIADMVFKASTLGQAAYIHLIIDHQSVPDELMPFRMLKYTCNFIDLYLKNNQTSRIPLIIPLVVYHGARSWNYTININELVDSPKELIEKYFLKSFILVDLSRIDDAILRQEVKAGVMSMTLKYIFYRDILPHLPKIFELLKEIKRSTYGKMVVEQVLVYIYCRGDINKENFVSMVKREFAELGESAMTLAEQFRQEGIEKGVEKGKTEVVGRLLREGLSLLLIEKVSGLSLEQIKKIQSKNQIEA